MLVGEFPGVNVVDSSGSVMAFCFSRHLDDIGVSFGVSFGVVGEVGS